MDVWWQSGGSLTRWLLLVALVAASAVLPTTATPSAASAANEVVVHTPSPAPGALEPAGRTVLRAWLRSPEPVTSVTLRIDGEEVADTAVRAADAEEAEVRAALDLAPGDHMAQLAFTDAAGQHAERTWSFTSTERSTRRFAGPGRIDTAVALSQALFPESATAGAAVLARADDFADALAGVPLSTSVHGPLLLSSGGGLSAATAAELRRVLPAGASVHLLGGPAALGDAVRRDVQQLGFSTARHGGADRYATSAAVAARLPPSSGAVVASGQSFPDALAASAPAARDGLPILLTATEGLPEPTAAALDDRGVTTATIVGGDAVVGDGVEQQLREHVAQVRRVAGADRYATAVAVLEAFYDQPASMSLASGVAFPDALAGSRHAAAHAQPLLLTAPRRLPSAPAEAIRRHRPHELAVYGGLVAVDEAVVATAVRAAQDGTGGVRVTATFPGDGETVAALDSLRVRVDRPVDLSRSSVYVEVAGVELRGAVEQPAADTLAFRAHDGQATPPMDIAHPVRVVVQAGSSDGQRGHHETAFTYLLADPVYATAGPVELHLPSRRVEMVGFHESNHDGARQQTPRDTATPKQVLASRHRQTGSHTSADVVADPDREVLAPVTGRVLRAGSYVLYCDYTDHYAVIEPDARPGWEVKMLHFRGLRVGAGDRVVAGLTVVGDGPRQLPFRSQVDDASDPRDWPHVHLEVVDPSIPDRPGRGC